MAPIMYMDDVCHKGCHLGNWTVGKPAAVQRYKRGVKQFKANWGAQGGPVHLIPPVNSHIIPRLYWGGQGVALCVVCNIAAALRIKS